MTDIRTAPTPPPVAQPNAASIKSVETKKKTFSLHSIKQIKNVTDLKNWIADFICFRKKTDGIIVSSNNHIVLNNNQAIETQFTSPTTLLNNLPEIKAIEPSNVPELAIEKIEEANSAAINYNKILSDDQKTNYQQLNKLGSLILKINKHSNTVGPFRTSGPYNKIQLVFKRLIANQPIDDLFLNDNEIGLNSLTSAYKQFAAHLIDKNLENVDNIPISSMTHFSQMTKNLQQMQAKTNKTDEASITKANAELSQAFLSLGKTPLTLQLMIPLFAEIAKNTSINKMTPANLATCFAPNLIKRSGLTFESSIELNKTSVRYLEALINHDLKLQSYDI